MIAAVVIDTNAYSMFRRGVPEVVDVFIHVPRLIVPLVVLSELLAGFAGGSRVERNRTELAMFTASPRVSLMLPDRETAEAYAGVFNQLRRDGHPIPTNDIWVAATSLQLSVPLISLDKHFRFVHGLRVSADMDTLLGVAGGTKESR